MPFNCVAQNGCHIMQESQNITYVSLNISENFTKRKVFFRVLGLFPDD